MDRSVAEHHARVRPAHYEDMLSDEERAAAETLPPVIVAYRNNRYSDAIRLANAEGLVEERITVE